MCISKQNVLKLGNDITLERIYNIVVAVIVFSMLILAFMALLRPISMSQYQAVVNLSHMANNPETQKMAHQLLQQQGINRAKYFKLMQAYQYENSKVHYYPALSLEDK